MLQGYKKSLKLQNNISGMKQLLLLFAIFFAATVQSQSLKDLLYSGKMKNDSNSVIRKGDDLKDKIDTSAKKATPAPEKPKADLAVKKDSMGKATATNPVEGNISRDSLASPDLSPETPVAPTPAAAPLNVNSENNKRWKQFVDTVIGSIKAEVLPNKKIKKGDYSVMVDYTINTDGTITIGNIFISPESELLQQQLKERLGIDTPVLLPVTGSNGVARKTNRRYSFLLSKN